MQTHCGTVCTNQYSYLSNVNFPSAKLSKTTMSLSSIAMFVGTGNLLPTNTSLASACQVSLSVSLHFKIGVGLLVGFYLAEE